MYCVLPALVACYRMVPLTSNDMYVQFPDLWILHYRQEQRVLVRLVRVPIIAQQYVRKFGRMLSAHLCGCMNC